MTAYVVFIRERMRNRAEYEVYREKSRPVNASHPLKGLALYGQHEVLEGPAIEGAVILEFPSIEAAKAYRLPRLHRRRNTADQIKRLEIQIRA
jgi:uncharacterized protein (DUF1330 family)